MRLQQIGCLLLLALVKAKVDFSQFYLPPCCQLPYMDTFQTFPENLPRIGPPFKREAVEKDMPPDSTQTKPSEAETREGKTYILNVPYDAFPKPFSAITTNSSELELNQTRLTRVPRTSNFSPEGNDEKWESNKLRSTSTNVADQMVSYMTTGIDPENQFPGIPARQMKTLPSFWVKYLKRALYQSLTDGKGLDNSIAINSRNNAKAEKPKLKYPHFWKSIKSAPLHYVDRMSRVSTDPQATLLLPVEVGPIVSGVLVNTPHGSLQLRVASELHNPSTVDPNCRCHLINPGEILMAYWTVSRIFKEDGAPALQYLVYPLPHSVPTPPEMIPFQNAEMFFASPADPFQLNSHFANIQNQLGQYHASPQLPAPPLVINPEQMQHSLDVQKVSIPEEVPPMLMPFVTRLGDAGFPFFNQNGAMQNFLNDPALNYQTIPYSDLNIVNTNGQNSLDFPLPFPTPSMLPPRIAPSTSPQPPEPAEKPNKPTFPNSIQDIISPEAEKQTQPTPSQDNFASLSPTLQPQFISENNDLQPSPTPDPPIQFIHPLQHLPIIFNIPPSFPSPFLALAIRPTQGNALGTRDRNAFPIRGKATLISKGKLNSHRDRGQHHVKVSDNLPYVVPNLLDNERKYYPLRQSQSYYKYLTSSSVKNRRRQVHHNRQQPRRSRLHDIDNKHGYILDF